MTSKEREKGVSRVVDYSKMLPNKNILPDRHVIFRALDITTKPYRVIILGQDPYPTKGMATGLAFAIKKDRIVPKSLLNIIHELGPNKRYPFDVTLEPWAKQGVLLLNTALTVFEGEPNSHASLWRDLIEKELETISMENTNMVFMLWGSNAKSFKKHIKGDQLILETSHPVTKEFFGNGHFMMANEYLTNKGKSPIKW